MATDAPPENADNQSGASPAPYNPLTHATHEPPSSNNLVRDLMSVYESLTQSKTPQTPAEPGYSSQQQQPPHHYPHPSQQQPPHQQYPHGSPPQQQQPASFNMSPTAYHVPPPPSYPPTQQGTVPPQQPHAPPSYYADPAYAAQQQQPYIVPAPEHAQQHASYPAPAPAPPAEQEEEEEDNESEEAEEPTSRGRRKRRGSDVSSNSGKGSAGGAKGRKKAKKASDGRWSKRFTWPEDLHRDFVSAIFDVGLKHSSPSTILEHMPKHEQITAERIKSHLQKYRMHRLKSKKEFISSYESSLRNFQARGLAGVKTISSGEVAAHLTYTSLGDSSGKASSKSKAAAPTGQPPQPAGDPPKDARPQNDALMLPQLTDAEKQSPIGAAMGYLMGLFFSLKQQLMIQRAIDAGKGDKPKNDAPVQAVFNSFVAGSTMTTPARTSAAPSTAEHAQSTYPPAQQGTQTQQAAQAGNVLSAPSVRTNIEENSMMKQEMQNQMALQNKMRALKQQELNKYKNASPQQQEGGGGGEEEKDKSGHHIQHSAVPTKEEEEAAHAAEAAGRTQGAGEPPGNDAAPSQRSRHQSLSIGASDEFWNTDVVDEQLFEFLMNN